MLTEFGKRLRSIRIDKDLLLKDMADLLEVTPSFLSAVETGRKGVPSKWPEIISEKLQLDRSELKKLSQLAEEATVNVKIDLKNASTVQRNAALSFARTFDSMSEEDAKRIIDFLHKERK